MVTIRAACPFCGDITLRPDDIDLRIGENTATYAFTCPACQQRIVKPADIAVLDLLAQGGVKPHSAEPAPLEALEPKTGPALTYDDLLDFATALAAEDYPSAAAGRETAGT